MTISYSEALLIAVFALIATCKAAYIDGFNGNSTAFCGGAAVGDTDVSLLATDHPSINILSPPVNVTFSTFSSGTATYALAVSINASYDPLNGRYVASFLPFAPRQGITGQNASLTNNVNSTYYNSLNYSTWFTHPPNAGYGLSSYSGYNPLSMPTGWSYSNGGSCSRIIISGSIPVATLKAAGVATTLDITATGSPSPYPDVYGLTGVMYLTYVLLTNSTGTLTDLTAPYSYVSWVYPWTVAYPSASYAYSSSITTSTGDCILYVGVTSVYMPSLSTYQLQITLQLVMNTLLGSDSGSMSFVSATGVVTTSTSPYVSVGSSGGFTCNYCPSASVVAIAPYTANYQLLSVGGFPVGSYGGNLAFVLNTRTCKTNSTGGPPACNSVVTSTISLPFVVEVTAAQLVSSTVQTQLVFYTNSSFTTVSPNTTSTVYTDGQRICAAAVVTNYANYGSGVISPSLWSVYLCGLAMANSSVPSSASSTAPNNLNLTTCFGSSPSAVLMSANASNANAIAVDYYHFTQYGVVVPGGVGFCFSARYKILDTTAYSTVVVAQQYMEVVMSLSTPSSKKKKRSLPEPRDESSEEAQLMPLATVGPPPLGLATAVVAHVHVTTDGGSFKVLWNNTQTFCNSFGFWQPPPPPGFPEGSPSSQDALTISRLGKEVKSNENDASVILYAMLSVVLLLAGIIVLLVVVLVRGHRHSAEKRRGAPSPPDIESRPRLATNSQPRPPSLNPTRYIALKKITSTKA